MNPAYKALHDQMIGCRFGKLTVIGKAPRTAHRARFQCRCDCGALVNRDGRDLRRGRATSCCCCRAALCACGRQFGVAA